MPPKNPLSLEEPETEPVRRRILDGAERMIIDHPVENFSVQRLSNRLRVARRTIYNQFEGREALYRATIIRWIERVESSIDGPAAPLDAKETSLVTKCTAVMEFLTSDGCRALRQVVERDDHALPWLRPFYERRIRTAVRLAIEECVIGCGFEVDAALFCNDLLRILEMATSPSLKNSMPLSANEIVKIISARYLTPIEVSPAPSNAEVTPLPSVARLAVAQISG
ncbi:TetR/AcrR family transcriptional regulator [Sphingomonas koreensis]|nr:TetR/AcrR family transcriptional regulator [Sphingomonas koreensis]